MSDSHDDEEAGLSSINDRDPVAIGVIRRPFGVHGQCYVEAFGRTLSLLSRGEQVYAGHTPSNVSGLCLAETKDTSNGHVCRFEGYDDRDAVGLLRGKYLFLPQERLPALAKGEHYHFELEGMRVVTAGSGREIGTVTGVKSFPTVDALEVARQNGEPLLVSLSEGIVQTIDRSARRIVVSESMLDEILG